MKINWFKIDKYLVIRLIHIIVNYLQLNENYKNKYIKDNIESLNNLLIYLKQGYVCKDCDEIYHDCNCTILENYKILDFIKYNLSNSLIHILKHMIKKDLDHSLEYRNKLINKLKI